MHTDEQKQTDCNKVARVCSANISWVHNLGANEHREHDNDII